MRQAWTAFSAKAQKLAEQRIEQKAVSSFFERLLLRNEEKKLSPKAQREHASIMSLYQSAPGQDLDTAKGTLWGAVNAVSYYVDHVRSEGAQEKDWIARGLALVVP